MIDPECGIPVLQCGGVGLTVILLGAFLFFLLMNREGN